MEELLTVNTIVADGTQSEFEINFAGGYLDVNDVQVRVYDTDMLAYTEPVVTFVGEFQISLSPVPLAGKIIKIYRNTPVNAPIVDFSDGSIVNEQNLDTNAKQAIFAIAEIRDTITTVEDVDGLGASVVAANNAAEDALEAAETANTAAAGAAAAAEAVANLAGPTGAANVGTADSVSVQEMLQRKVHHVTSRTAMKALNVTRATVAFLKEDKRSGLFRLVNATPPSDPQEGLYVASNTSGYYWERVWDGIHGRPEWFGAVTGGPDCVTAIRACATLCPITLLGQQDYFIHSKLVWDFSYRTLRGVRAAGDTDDGGTTNIVTTFANDDAILFGLASAPGSTAGFINESTIEHLNVKMGATRIPPASGLVENAKAGIRTQYVIRSFMTNVSTSNFSMGFSVWRTIYFKQRDCLAYSDSAATATTNDNWWGYHIRSDSPFSGFPGGNASFLQFQCSAINVYGGHPLKVGLALYGVSTGSYAGLYTDTFIRDFESGGCYKGMVVIGDSSATITNTDCHIDHPVLDGISDVGLEILGVNGGGSIRVTEPYVSSFGGSAAIFLHDNSGLVAIDGGHCVRVAGGAYGVFVQASAGTRVQGLTLSDFAQPVGLTSSSECLIDVAAQQVNVVNLSNSGVIITGSPRNKIVLELGGVPASLGAGVNIDNSSAECYIDVSLVRAGTTTNRIFNRTAGSPVTTQGNVSGHFIVNPGAGAVA